MSRLIPATESFTSPEAETKKLAQLLNPEAAIVSIAPTTIPSIA